MNLDLGKIEHFKEMRKERTIKGIEAREDNANKRMMLAKINIPKEIYEGILENCETGHNSYIYRAIGVIRKEKYYELAKKYATEMGLTYHQFETGEVKIYWEDLFNL